MSTISADEYFAQLHKIVSVLDKENITLLRTMKMEGPRNLQNVARASKLPYTTVYSRVTRLESSGLLKPIIHPNYSKIGLAQGIVLVTPLVGKELLAREALKIPKFWLKIIRCIGDCNGYFAIVAVPMDRTKEYEDYLDQLVVRGLIRNWRGYWLGENIAPVPNFDYYDIEKKTWSFEWKQWLTQFKKRDKTSTKIAKSQGVTEFDERDLIILKELRKNARVTLASLAKMLHVTLPAVKYRYDSIVQKGLIHDWVINILPFAPEISELSEVRLDFKDEALYRNGEELFNKLPFVVLYSKIKGLNSLSVRIYLPRLEQANLLTFLSQLVKENVLSSYTFSQLDRMTIEAQTFSYEEYSDTKKGWNYDNRKYLEALDNLLVDWPKRENQLVNFQTGVSPSVF